MLYGLTMESLAALVALMAAITVVGGPIALGLTFIEPAKSSFNKLRVGAVILFSLPAIFIGVIFMTANIGLGGRLYGLFGFGVSTFALYRTIKQMRRNRNPDKGLIQD
ncbi:MAG: hypothetical protein HQ452_00065 [Actinobacteria bacterium]|jgi:hypothetical protein|nr:hypothetical protein [Actinomycetota bacterium]